MCLWYLRTMCVVFTVFVFVLCLVPLSEFTVFMMVLTIVRGPCTAAVVPLRQTTVLLKYGIGVRFVLAR